MKAKQIIEIDFDGVSTKEEVHNRISKAFDFPDYYGMNWDAFDECIRDLESVPHKIRIKGYNALKKILPREAYLLTECLNDYQKAKEAHGVEVEIT